MLEFVSQYERQVRQFKSSLEAHTHTVEAIRGEGEEYSEEKWTKLSKVRAKSAREEGEGGGGEREREKEGCKGRG